MRQIICPTKDHYVIRYTDTERCPSCRSHQVYRRDEHYEGKLIDSRTHCHKCHLSTTYRRTP